jgi:hypothetical protein
VRKSHSQIVTFLAISYRAPSIIHKFFRFFYDLTAYLGEGALSHGRVTRYLDVHMGIRSHQDLHLGSIRLRKSRCKLGDSFLCWYFKVLLSVARQKQSSWKSLHFKKEETQQPSRSRCSTITRRVRTHLINVLAITEVSLWKVSLTMVRECACTGIHSPTIPSDFSFIEEAQRFRPLPPRSAFLLLFVTPHAVLAYAH